MALVLTPLAGIPYIEPGDDLGGKIISALEHNKVALKDRDILVIAQKVISKAEGRLVNLAEIQPSARAVNLALETEKDPRMVELILSESRELLRTRPGTIIVEHRLGFVCANAGIDHSNVKGGHGDPLDWVLLLPVDPDRSADCLRSQLEDRYGVQIGVLIIDSHGRAWRMGVVGTTIGLSGLPGLVDLRGQPDLFGFHLKITQLACADELAAAASLVMGQAAEGMPVVHVRGFPYPLREASFGELLRPRAMDMFR
jgi:coenzyme F420-0:L-glutamate ligase / coenzyme F420-1:gamma-L-glutamate ligase